MPIDPDNPPIAAIRDLLTAAFTIQTLHRFCQDRPRFRPLVAEFSPSDGLADMVEKTITFCDKGPFWDELLAEVRRACPRQYERFAPRLSAALPSAYPPGSKPASSAAPTPPAPPPHFVGREQELTALAQALTRSDQAQAITALQGMGGIGKTALAQQLTAQLGGQSPDGRLPGGVFWADLPASDGDPLPILHAWGQLCGHDLGALADPQARAQAVRGLLAGRVKERGRALAVLDDVRQEWLAGARTLKGALPPGVPALITTREIKAAQALRARITRLDLLSDEEARALLADLSGGDLSGEEAGRVAELCGCLPLALELAAAAAAEEGGGWLLAHLEKESARLDALALDDPARKEESGRRSGGRPDRSQGTPARPQVPR